VGRQSGRFTLLSSQFFPQIAVADIRNDRAEFAPKYRGNHNDASVGYGTDYDTPTDRGLALLYCKTSGEPACYSTQHGNRKCKDTYNLDNRAKTAVGSCHPEIIDMVFTCSGTYDSRPRLSIEALVMLQSGKYLIKGDMPGALDQTIIGQ